MHFGLADEVSSEGEDTPISLAGHSGACLLPWPLQPTRHPWLPSQVHRGEILGALLGAAHGAAAIPEELKRGLKSRRALVLTVTTQVLSKQVQKAR